MQRCVKCKAEIAGLDLQGLLPGAAGAPSAQVPFGSKYGESNKFLPRAAPAPLSAGEATRLRKIGLRAKRLFDLATLFALSQSIAARL